jgi:Leucine-rich repeat (LRR) protein
LHLQENQFSGLLPSQIGLLTMLTRLNLSKNKLKGQLPPGLINLSGLKSLHLYDNELTGFIPSHISKLTDLGESYLVYPKRRLLRVLRLTTSLASLVQRKSICAVTS